MTRPRPTRSDRIALRVYPHTQRLITDAIADLETHGVYTTQTELIEAVLHDRLPASASDLETLIRARRAEAPA